VTYRSLLVAGAACLVRVARRLFVGGRVDWLDLGDNAARDIGSVSGYLQVPLGDLSKDCPRV
jgi:hypothetical protein